MTARRTRIARIRMLLLGAALNGLLLGACETVEPGTITPSGRPEAVFSNSEPDAVRAALASGCVSRGLRVREQSTSHVLCSRNLTGSEAYLVRLLVGERSATYPQQKLHFSVVPEGENVRVQARQWMEARIAFGPISRRELVGETHHGDVQELLYSLGGQ